ncbi:MAG: SIR2 family protein [Thermoleophilia bacterium]
MENLRNRVLADLDANGTAAFARQLGGRNLEEALSRLRRIAALITGSQKVDGLTAAQALDLDTAVCRAIVKALNIEAANPEPVYHLAAWAARADYHQPVEIFTVNYDLLLETALERMSVPYFDGFVGNIRARFHTELVEGTPGSDAESMPSFFVRLWKMHGSVNWARHEGEIVRIGQPVSDWQAAAIYPSDTKYEESRRVPFVVLQDRLRRSLHQPETLAIVAGYSFGDGHLNELLFDAASRRERSEFVVFCYEDIPSELAERAATTPNIQVASGREAIVGGVRGDWKTPSDPPPNLWEDGQFGLRDFANLAAYLARSTTREPAGDSLLRALLRGAIEEDGKAGDAKSYV